MEAKASSGRTDGKIFLTIHLVDLNSIGLMVLLTMVQYYHFANFTIILINVKYS